MYTTYDTPGEFFGPGYTVDTANNKIQLNTSGSGAELLSIGAFTTSYATNNELTISGHGLQVGHVVQLTTSGTLPAPLALGTDYWVKSTPTTGTLTLSDSILGDEIALTDNGSGTHTLHSQPILVNLTDTQSSSSTAQVVFAIVDGIYKRFFTIPSEDKPSKFEVTRDGYIDAETEELVYTYSIQIRVTAGSLIASNS